ncbi:GNAT family N-acetyltransferase [uncultured Tateyamaria sp.]|uniref:GNAT family N-acetyltransferase n=1 Tax=uncultured Tateyamaria sp. TaxID=455651 RepID=UPI002604BC9B|nr:GNAT family N-acetyltransferase [uncultured Tateyamaria sp.]
MIEIHMRSINSDDRKQWEELWAAYNAFYGREGETALSATVISITWERLLNPKEPVFGLVAEKSDALIGLAHFVFHRNLIQTSDTCYMQDLFTAPDARGSGVAQRLIKKIGETCRKHGVSDIYWHTHSDNVDARRLYDRIATNTDFLVYRVKV